MLLCLFVPLIVTTDVKSLYNKHLEFRWHSTDKGNKQNCSHKNHYSIFGTYTCPKQLYFKLQVLPANHMVCNGNYLCYLFLSLCLKANVHAFPTIIDDIYMTWEETQDQL